METLLVRPENNEQLKAIKAVLKALNVDFTLKKEKKYNTGFVEKILESRREAKEGIVTAINIENIWK